jgi:hypothetical protein
LDKSIVEPKFFFHYLHYNMDILNEYVVGVQPKFSHESFLTRNLVLPSITVQQNIVSHLDVMEASLIAFERLTAETDSKATLLLNSYLSTTNVSPTMEASADSATVSDSEEVENTITYA